MEGASSAGSIKQTFSVGKQSNCSSNGLSWLSWVCEGSKWQRVERQRHNDKVNRWEKPATAQGVFSWKMITWKTEVGKWWLKGERDHSWDIWQNSPSISVCVLCLFYLFRREYAQCASIFTDCHAHLCKQGLPVVKAKAFISWGAPVKFEHLLTQHVAYILLQGIYAVLKHILSVIMYIYFQQRPMGW